MPFLLKYTDKKANLCIKKFLIDLLAPQDQVKEVNFENLWLEVVNPSFIKSFY